MYSNTTGKTTIAVVLLPSGVKLYKALTIAGSDSGGGAGIQADLHTFSALGVYGASVITSITAQNTVEVTDIFHVPPTTIRAQFRTVMRDIGAQAVKSGMLSTCEIIETVAEEVRRHRIEKYVLDPVMISKSGDRLLEADAVDTLVRKLIPLAAIVTPNLPEAECITNVPIRTIADMRRAADMILKMGANAVLIKGGHRSGPATDVYADRQGFVELTSRRIRTKNTHGTGCTLSAAIAAEMAKGQSPLQATRTAKRYVTHALRHALSVGKGAGPLGHHYRLWGRLR